MVSSSMFKQNGFTLLETLVALAVLAIALGVIYQIFGTSLRNMQYSRDYSYAQMLAESKLSELSKGVPVKAGTWGGDFNDKYSWVMDVAQLPTVSEDGTDAIDKYRVDFVVSWSAGNNQRTISLRTYRLAVAGL